MFKRRSPIKTRQSHPNIQVDWETPEPRKPVPRIFFFDKYYQSPRSKPEIHAVKKPKIEHDASKEIENPAVTQWSPNGKTIQTYQHDDGALHHLRLRSKQLFLYCDKVQLPGETLSPPKLKLETLKLRTTVTKETILFMANYIRYNKYQRNPSQLALFNYRSASTLSKLADYAELPEANTQKQFCHIISHGLGGQFSHEIIAKNNNYYRKAKLICSPQNKENIFIGTDACNGQMMIIENLVSHLLLKDMADEIQIEAELEYNAPLGDGIMFGHGLSYQITCFKNNLEIYNDEFKFNPLSYDKPVKSMPERLKEEVEKIIYRQSLSETPDQQLKFI